MMETISKYDYFIKSIKEGQHLYRDWIISIFTVVFGEKSSSPKPFDLYHNESGNCVEVFVDDKWMKLDNVKYLEIPYIYHEVVPLLKAGDIGNALEDVKNTTWGEMFFNQRVLYYSAGTYIGYMQDPISLKKIGSIFAKEMLDNPKPGQQYEDGKLYVRDLQKFGQAIQDLGNYEFFVPSVDKRGLSAPPNNETLKNELFEKYKDQLGDTVIQAKIQDELVNNYKEYIKGTPAEGFIYKNKSINTAIKRMFLLHGVESGFGGVQKPIIIKKSLDQGMDTKEFPMLMNGLRNGAYSRGALTQLAGAGVNLLNRMFQNILIDVDTSKDGVKGFCGTKDTVEMVITNNTSFIGRYMKVNGLPKVIESTDLSRTTPVDLYTPLWCKASGNDVCSKCIGDNLSKYPKSMGTVITKIASTMMDKMMGSAHAKEQVLVKIPEGWLK